MHGSQYPRCLNWSLVSSVFDVRAWMMIPTLWSAAPATFQSFSQSRGIVIQWFNSTSVRTIGELGPLRSFLGHAVKHNPCVFVSAGSLTALMIVNATAHAAVTPIMRGGGCIPQVSTHGCGVACRNPVLITPAPWAFPPL